MGWQRLSDISSLVVMPARQLQMGPEEEKTTLYIASKLVHVPAVSELLARGVRVDVANKVR